MAKPFINPVLVELRDAISTAEALLGKSEFSKRDEAHFNLMLAKIATLNKNSAPVDNAKERFFRSLFNGEVPEQRTTPFESGTQSITYTQGAEGGFLVPQEYFDQLILGMAQYDPLLDKNVVTLIESKNQSLRPITVPGWDLSTYAAVRISEGSQQNPQTTPAAAKASLEAYMYRANLPVTYEFEEDSFMNTADLLNIAFQIAFARGIGVDLAIGTGVSQPQGVLTGAAASGGITFASGSIDADDIENAYFSVNRWYRQSPKCAWVMSDSVYQQVRKAKDNAGRPLINVVKDKEVIHGKPVYVSPSIPSGAGQDGIVFGDLAHFVVRVSNMTIQRSIQASQAGADFGQAMFTGRMRADARVVDPTGGTNAPIKFIQLHS